jgi:O-antigen ligase
MLAFLLAVAVPSLLAFNLPPSPTLLNQIAAVALWGWVIAVPVRRVVECRRAALDAVPLLLAVACVGLAAGWSWARLGLPAGLAASALALLAAAAVAALHGGMAGPAGAERFFVAWVAAGLFSTVIALLQVFAPGWTDGEIIAHSGLPGRAVGNLRQPNHLSSLLLWSSVALVPLIESRKLPRSFGAVLFALFVFAVELSASRTGMVGVGVIAAWGLLDRRLSGQTRLMLLSAPLIYGIGWIGMTRWAAAGQHVFGAAARLGESDVSGSRFGIWSNTRALIAEAPWRGVGFGEFNFAWSLTPFPGRPVAFFDHTHNLVLQLVVELGKPLGGLVVLLLLAALVLALARALRPQGLEGSLSRTAFVMVLLVALHSQLEYPLWYAYFLLPAAWAWGYALQERANARQGEAPALTPASPVMVAAGLALVAGSLWALADYKVVSRIFEPGEDAAPLAQRIRDGQRTLWFAHHADYAAVTTVDHPSQAWDAFRRAPYYLLDTRLMMAWAKAFAERGDLERARHIAQRLREFHNAQSDEFFSVCDELEPGQERPFQCDPPSRAMDWRDFRDLP